MFGWERENLVPWLLTFGQILWWSQCTPWCASYYYLCIFIYFCFNICQHKSNFYLEETSICMTSGNVWLGKFILLLMNSGFSSVPEKIPKNKNAARLAMSHAVHSFMSLYICTLIAPGGCACTINQTTHYLCFFPTKSIYVLQV